MNLIFKLAYKDILQSKKLVLFFIFNLSLGLSSFVALQSFNKNIKDQLQSNQKEILGADFVVSSRRQLTPDELNKIESFFPVGFKKYQTFEFFAMMSFQNQSRLISVKAVEDRFPFYGKLLLQSGAKKINSREAWLFSEISNQLNIQKNDQFQLGAMSFKVSDFIQRDPSLTFRAGNIAPRIYINISDLPATGLIKYGSTYTESYSYAWNSAVDTKAILNLLETQIKDPTIQFTDAQIAGESAGKQIAYLSDYLGLVSIVALLLSLLGSAYIFKLFLNQKIKDIAILKCLGLQSDQAIQIYLLVNLFLSLLSIPIVVLLTSILLPLIQFFIQQFSTLEMSIHLDFFSILIATVMAIGGGLLVNLPLVGYIRSITTVQLLGEESKFSQADFKKWWLFAPLFIFVLLLTIYVAQSFKLASYFLVAISLIGLFVLFIVRILLLLGKNNFFQRRLSQWRQRYVLKGLVRRPQEISTLFLTITIGALLVNLMPQLKTSIQSEFEVGENSKLPSLFLFDIQDDQIEPLKDFLQSQNYSWTGISPMVRARIISINDLPYERALQGGDFQTREQEQEARFRNRGVNLSFREKLSSSESIVEGQYWQPQDQPGEIAQLSIEKSFADRLKIQLGDILKFDIQGIEIKGKVTSFRKVKWASFEPNFFIVVQPGFLELAPKIYIMSISQLSTENKNQLQNQLAHKFANVSIIDVSRTVGEVLQQAEKMSWSLELMAWLALLTGYIVIFSIIRTNMQLRRWEWNLLKILGTNSGSILRIVLGELLLITVAASLLGLTLSHLICFVLTKQIFEGQFAVNFAWTVFTFILINVIAIFVGWFSSIQIVNENPKQILTGQNK